jgi:hypothetical protein
VFDSIRIIETELPIEDAGPVTRWRTVFEATLAGLGMLHSGLRLPAAEACSAASAGSSLASEKVLKRDEK